jgi:hypothetical protein
MDQFVNHIIIICRVMIVQLAVTNTEIASSVFGYLILSSALKSFFFCLHDIQYVKGMSSCPWYVDAPKVLGKRNNNGVLMDHQTL